MGTARESKPRELIDPCYKSEPRYWVPTADIVSAFSRGRIHKQWLLVVRAITNATNERTVISCVIGAVGIGHSSWAIRLAKAPVKLLCAFLSILNSFVLDFVARQKVGGMNLSNFIIKQLPILPPVVLEEGVHWSPSVRVVEWIVTRVLELTYTTWDLEPFARDCGFDGPPLHWDEERRFLIRGELDAAFFHLYLQSDTDGEWVKANTETEDDLKRLRASFSKPRDAVDYIMETFPIVKRKDIEKYGDYRTKLRILQIYDEMQQAMRTGSEYQTRLDPPPGDKRCCHPPRATVSV